MLIDEAEITVEAGHGGPGKVSFFHHERGPDGGIGGRGGDVYFQATSDLTALSRYASKKSFSAQNGEMGQSNQKTGRDGEDMELLLPVGTGVEDLESGEKWEIVLPTDRILIVKGGLGGLGNAQLRSARNTTPTKAQTGLPGQKRSVRLVLKLIADFGLIGLPNGGKSSLLNELTKANAKVGNYSFTTLEPNLGVLELPSKSVILADIPGLIEGAAEGKGLGDKFLKHVEKVPVLLHCISTESSDPLADYKTIRTELKKYNPELLKKKEIILLTKTDMVSAEEVKEKISQLKKTRKIVLPVSIHDWDSLEKLKKLLSKE